METKMIWGNFASSDLEKTRDFYSDLGFVFNGTHSTDENASFIFGQNKFIINFFKKAVLKDETNGGIGNWESQSEIIFSLSAESEEEVDQWYEKVHTIGGKIISEPQPYKEGYTFCFSDPDGHKFNVLYWQGM
ncbi:VOC family protein [Flavobacterium sp. MC2016-06]|jgi:predicted lactoylglutathione lyase|uniref:VOC family protein n=1 Tax=Flavobacterium sp. MC2016-06 TaxID=2676308 RepID=UPI0012BB0804|nr:VOC family protein [Flavobacterium sp. MC2016-06]MBU3858481.1 VOC family protein [Flavobacterium sp. MC2016-06]